MEDEELRTVFTVFDRDGDGTVNTQELGVVMKSLGMDPTDEELKEMIDEVDEDGSGEIEFEEFKMLMKKQIEQNKPEEELKEVFHRFDKERKGYIDANDLFAIFRDMGEDEVSLEDCQTMIEANRLVTKDELDDSRKGLNFEEFVSTLMYR